MDKTAKKFRKELDELRQRYGALILVPCDDEENERYRQMLKDGKPLPEGLFRDESATRIEYYTFYRSTTTCFSEKEQQEYLAYKKLQLLETIKNCVVFFTILTVIGLVGAVISILNLL